MNEDAQPAIYAMGTTTPEPIDLRDYFAAAALQGMLANGHWNENCVELAYAHADAMLKQRGK